MSLRLFFEKLRLKFITLEIEQLLNGHVIFSGRSVYCPEADKTYGGFFSAPKTCSLCFAELRKLRKPPVNITRCVQCRESGPIIRGCGFGR